ncbi:MAG: thymidylate kinase [Nitrospinae bacterium]|nr:thymidylate kinase [Nitrospinota bacterium]
MTERNFYGRGLPAMDTRQLTGKLIVIEGSDGSGRSTQISLISNWLERIGYPTVTVGLKRSTLVGEELESAKQGNVMSPITHSLFYATDFADQLENRIIPGLRSGFVVLADRYIYTLMARDIVRGENEQWIKGVYGIALVPDAVFYLQVPPKVLAERNLRKNLVLDYWESGMDIRRSGDRYECFIQYQTKLRQTFTAMKDTYGFQIINGNRLTRTITNELQAKIEGILRPAQTPSVKQTSAKKVKTGGKTA